MKINHQINLFFEYRMAERLITKIEKNLQVLNNKEGLFWEKRKKTNEQAKEKWLNRQEEILIEWNSSNDYYIDEFPKEKG